MYLSQANLMKKYDLSRSTAHRICAFMKSSGKYARDVRVISGLMRYEEDAFIKASNERIRKEW